MEWIREDISTLFIHRFVHCIMEIGITNKNVGKHENRTTLIDGAEERNTQKYKSFHLFMRTAGCCRLPFPDTFYGTRAIRNNNNNQTGTPNNTKCTLSRSAARSIFSSIRWLRLRT